VILYLAFLGLPVLYAFYISFQRWGGMDIPVFVGLDNYQRLLADEVFWTALRNSFLYALMSVPSLTVMSLVTAVLVNQALPLRNLFKSLTFVPVIMASTVVGVVWLFIYQPDVGLLNDVLRLAGLSGHLWLGDTLTALPSLAAVGIWQRFGWFSVLFLAGLQDVPVEQQEAAAIDGASSGQIFWHVTLPLLRPTVALVSILAAIGSFQVFDMVFVMTGGGPAYATETLSFYIYNQAFQALNMGFATSMSFVLFGLVFILTLVQFRILRPATD
jgi:ABC-type sugar transport system permease subunit